MRGSGKPFQEKYEPIALPGDIVVVKLANGFVKDESTHPFYVVTECIPSPLWGGPHGVLGLYCATAAFGKPFVGDSSLQSGTNTNLNLAANGGAVTANPVAFQLQKHQFMQARFLVKKLPDSNNAYPQSIDDVDVSIAVPATAPRWGTSTIPGVLNAMAQGFMLGDYVPEPSQGNDIAAVTGAGHDPFNFAARTETYFYGNTAPQGAVTLTNQGKNAISTGGIGLAMSVFVMNLKLLPQEGLTKQWFMGYEVGVPTINGQLLDLNDVVIVPWQTQSAPVGYGTSG